MNEDSNTEQLSTEERLQAAIQALKLISEQGGDIVEPWSAEMARRALARIS